MVMRLAKKYNNKTRAKKNHRKRARGFYLGLARFYAQDFPGSVCELRRRAMFGEDMSVKFFMGVV
jgi:hypothetical protein